MRIEPFPTQRGRPARIENSMTQNSVWDDPEIKTGGEFVTMEKIGDGVAGTITAIRTHRFDDGKVVPQILLQTDDGEERTLTAGQVRLKAELSEQRPEAGDHLTVRLTDIEKRSGGKTLKHFSVAIRRAGNSPGPAPAFASPAPAATRAEPDWRAEQEAFANGQEAPVPAVNTAAAAAALAALTPEQRAALGL